MSEQLDPGAVVDARAVPLELEPLPPEEVRSGAPLAGYSVLGRLGGSEDALEIGVWEMTEGAATDVEVDEVFVVLVGSATVVIEGAAAPIELAPGSVVRLTTGMRTIWTVHERLRKLVLS